MYSLSLMTAHAQSGVQRTGVIHAVFFPCPLVFESSGLQNDIGQYIGLVIGIT